MESTTSLLIQSKYFSPVFNTAIFDGPVRMYFSQYQEPDALQVYFRMHDLLKEFRARDLDFVEDQSPKVFVMIYPDDETFFNSFENSETISIESLGPDLVVGVRGPMTENLSNRVVNQLQEIVTDWPRGAA